MWISPNNFLTTRPCLISKRREFLLININHDLLTVAVCAFLGKMVGVAIPPNNLPNGPAMMANTTQTVPTSNKILTAVMAYI